MPLCRCAMKRWIARRRLTFPWVMRLCLGCVLAFTFGCRDSAKHYTLKGQVLAKNVAAGQVSVDNEDIPGFMAAMAMNYTVKDPRGLQQIQPGDKITADVVVSDDGNYWLQHLTITDQSARGSLSIAAKPRELLPGEMVPDIPFINQDGKTVHLADFKGKAVLLTFIYTRCPFPTFCPLISSQFAAIHNDLAETPAVYQKTHLVSVSLDPSYDTAPVLRNYGLVYLKNTPLVFRSGTSSPPALRTYRSWHHPLALNITSRTIKSLTA